jgi:hypothetical protein
VRDQAASSQIPEVARRRVTSLRRVAAALVGAYLALWVPAIAVKVFDLDPSVGWPLAIVAAVLGSLAGSQQALEPFDSQEHRDSVIGWSVILGIIGVSLTLVLPVLWAVPAALAWVALVVFAARSLGGFGVHHT